MKHRLHIIALPHTATRKRTFVACAFTQNTLNFCKMMSERGHEVIHYGGEGSEAACSEHVTLVSEAERRAWFKSDWDKGELSDVVYDPSQPYWQTFNARSIQEVAKRIQPHDKICLIVGYAQAPVAQAFPNYPVCEYAIGYWGTVARHRNFACETWRHYVYGRQGEENGDHYDRAIPHYFDPADFPLGKHRGDYYLFLGRMIGRKGPHIAAQICEAAGVRLVMAGQGVTKKRRGEIHFSEGVVLGKHVEHVGHADVKKRAELLGNARALFVMTEYVGPFEMVSIEAMACGTPVITMDRGAFVETVQNGVNGFRCRNMAEAVSAVTKVRKLNHAAIREAALVRYSLDAVAPQYEEWFDSLHTLWWGKGWYEGFNAPGEKPGEKPSRMTAPKPKRRKR